MALGILAAPLASLLVVPWALRRHAAAATRRRAGRASPALTLRAGAGFALAVAAIQLAEQTLLNAGVLIVERAATPRWRASSSTRC